MLHPTAEDQERLDKFMGELLSDKPLFEEDFKPAANLTNSEEKVQFWRNDRYKLY